MKFKLNENHYLIISLPLSINSHINLSVYKPSPLQLACPLITRKFERWPQINIKKA